MRIKENWPSVKNRSLSVCVNRFILWYGLVHCLNGYLAILVGFLKVIMWGRNQSAIVQEKLFLQVKNNYVCVKLNSLAAYFQMISK